MGIDSLRESDEDVGGRSDHRAGARVTVGCERLKRSRPILFFVSIQVLQMDIDGLKHVETKGQTLS